MSAFADLDLSSSLSVCVLGSVNKREDLVQIQVEIVVNVSPNLDLFV